MKDLTQGSVTKHLLQMTAFLAISMAVQTLYLLADLYWVGHLGQEAIAALGVAGKLQRKFLFPKNFQEGIAEPGGTVAS
jgi:Na+-driven multidrug efflux pump